MLPTIRLAARTTCVTRRALVTVPRACFGSHHEFKFSKDLPNELLPEDPRSQPMNPDFPVKDSYDAFCKAALKKDPSLANLTKGQFLVAMRDLSIKKRNQQKLGSALAACIALFSYIVFATSDPVIV